MKSHVRVAVIGGGVVGASVLYHLTKAGWHDVVLIERNELTSGSTWHAAGGMHTINSDPNVAKLQRIHHQSLQGDRADLRPILRHPHYRRTDAGRNARAHGLVAAGPLAGPLFGMETEFVEMDEAARLFPLLAKRYLVGALYDPIEGHVDPAGVTHAFAKAARANGAEVYRFTRVTDIKPLPDGTWIRHHRQRQPACRACR